MKFNYFKTHFNYKKSNRLIILLLALDIFFILTHVLFIYLIYIRVQFDWSITRPFQLNKDGGYPELFQYLKYLIIICTTIYIMFYKRIYNYLSWLLLFILLLFDDAFQFHERFAVWVVEKYNYTSILGLRPQDLGELTYLVVFGPILLIFLILGYYYGNIKIKKTFIDLGLLFALFLFFGVVIDMFHQVVGDNRYVILFMIVLEDGGEMFALSFLTWYFYFLCLRSDNHNTYLFQNLINEKLIPGIIKKSFHK